MKGQICFKWNLFFFLGVQLPPDAMQEEEMSSLEVYFVIYIIITTNISGLHHLRYHHPENHHPKYNLHNQQHQHHCIVSKKQLESVSMKTKKQTKCIKQFRLKKYTVFTQINWRKNLQNVSEYYQYLKLPSLSTTALSTTSWCVPLQKI